MLLGCGDPIPNAPNGPVPGERVLLRRTPNQLGRLERLHGERVLTTQGTPYEEGYEHGFLLRDEMQAYYADYFRGKLLSAFEGFPEFTYAWYAHAEARAYTPDEHDELRGLVDGSGMSADAVLELQADPPWQAPATWFGASVRPIFGSTAFVVASPATVGGVTLVAASQSGLDFNLRHQYAMLQVHHPRGGYAFVTPTFVGQVLDVTSGWNEKGLYVSANQGKMRFENASGLSAGLLTRRLVQRCATLEDAEAMARSLGQHLGQGLILTVANAEGARRIELAQSVSDAWRARARFAVTPLKKPVSVLMAGTRFHDATLRVLSDPDAAERARESRLAALLKESSGRIDVSRAMEVLTDTLDVNTGRSQASERTVNLETPPCVFAIGPWHLASFGPITTFQSTVGDLTHGTLYLVHGLERVDSPAQFVSFGIQELLQATPSRAVQAPIPTLPEGPVATGPVAR